MNIKNINCNSAEDLELLESFLKKNKNSNTFRYFLTRPLTVIQNHKHTFLYFIEKSLFGYGHLDLENKKVWLGILIDEQYRNMGLGKKVVNHLINCCNENIYLSVDKTNTNALALYKKTGFKPINVFKNSIIMCLEKN